MLQQPTCLNFARCGNNREASGRLYCAPCQEDAKSLSERLGAANMRRDTVVPKNISDTLVQREGTHGPFSQTAKIAQHIKAVISAHGSRLNESQVEALDLIATKMARILSGDPNCAEHWHDIGGYARLGEKDLSV